MTKLNLNPVSLTSKLSEEYEYKEGIQIYINPLLMSDHQHCKKNQTFISTNQTFLCALRPFTASLNILQFYLPIIYTEQQGSLFNVTNIFLTEINEMFFKKLILKNSVNHLT